jgi:hypothetical protein
MMIVLTHTNTKAKLKKEESTATNRILLVDDDDPDILLTFKGTKEEKQ